LFRGELSQFGPGGFRSIFDFALGLDRQLRDFFLGRLRDPLPLFRGFSFRAIFN
jgi:hypothetical protein